MSRAKMPSAEITELHAGAPQSEPPKLRGAPAGKPGAIDVAAVRARLFAEVEQKLALDLDEEVQYELGRWLTVVETAKEQLLPRLLPEARVAVAALLQEKPKLQLARTIRYRMEKELLLNNGWVTRHLVRLSDGNAVVLVGLGLLLTMLLGFGFYLLLPWLEPHWYFKRLILLNDPSTLSIAEAAFLGGVVSILTRLREFSKLREFDPVFLFFNALLKPVLGIILGVFAYAFIKSGLVPLELKPLKGGDVDPPALGDRLPLGLQRAVHLRHHLAPRGRARRQEEGVIRQRRAGGGPERAFSVPADLGQRSARTNRAPRILAPDGNSGGATSAPRVCGPGDLG